MKSFFNPIALLTCLTLLGSSLTGLAQEKVRKAKPRPEQIEFQEMKQKVAEMRKKSAKLKEMGRWEEAEGLAAEAKKLYARLQERAGKPSKEHEKGVEAKKRATRGPATRDHIIKRLDEERPERHLGEAGHPGRVVERIIIREHRDGEHDVEQFEILQHDVHHDRATGRHPELGEISREDHVRIAIENLHAAGWHDVAERIEQEFHHRMEEHHAREQERGRSEMHRMIDEFERRFQETAHQYERHFEEMARRFEEAEHRFEETHRQFEHLGEAVGESHERIDRLERQLREREEHRD